METTHTACSAQCHEVQGNLSAYVDGEVTKSERGMVEVHLTECGSCREKLSETMRLIGAVAALPRIEAGPAYMRSLRERLDEPESMADRVLDLLTGRGATAGLGFALGAAACFMLMVGSPSPVTVGTPQTPGAGDGNVEVALGRRAPAPDGRAPVGAAPEVDERSAMLARATGVAPSTGPAGAPVSAQLPAVKDTPVVIASAPTHATPDPLGGVNPASLPPLPAPPILAPGTVRVARIPNDAEIENLKLDVGAGPAPSVTVAAAPGGSTRTGITAVASVVDRAARASVSANLGTPRTSATLGTPQTPTARPMRSDAVGTSPDNRGDTPDSGRAEIAEAVAPVEPATKMSELSGALSGTPLLSGDDAERAAAGVEAGHQLQVMVSRPAQFLGELGTAVGKVSGARITRVMVLAQPALQIELTFDGPATSVASLKEQLNHLSSVKAVAAMTTDKDPRRATILIPLASPIAR